jgi:hypothetical protein
MSSLHEAGGGAWLTEMCEDDVVLSGLAWAGATVSEELGLSPHRPDQSAG